MNRARSFAAGLLALCLVIAPSCAQRSDLARITPSAPMFGVYKSRLTDASGHAHRFRLLLFAAVPDRLHGEVLTPLGSTRLILDGGDGKLSVTYVPDGVSYVGQVSAEALERILGIRISLGDLVGGLMGTTEGGEGFTLKRTGSRLSLPELIEVTTDTASLRLELRKIRPLAAKAAPLGSGQPPEGTEIRSLDDLDLAEGAPSLLESKDGGS